MSQCGYGYSTMYKFPRTYAMRKTLKAIKIILNFPIDVWQMFITYLPGQIGVVLRRVFWRNRLKYLGEKVVIGVGIYFQNPQYISIDDKCWIDRNVVILAGPPHEGRITFEKQNPDFPLMHGEVYIGKFTHVAPNCVLSGMGGLYIGGNTTIASNSAIYSFSHHYRNLNNRDDDYQYSFTSMARFDQQSMIMGPVYIGDYCAVGLNSIILPGSSLKKGCWAAVGSIVSGSYPEQSLIYFEQEIRIKSIANLVIKE